MVAPLPSTLPPNGSDGSTGDERRRLALGPGILQPRPSVSGTAISLCAISRRAVALLQQSSEKGFRPLLQLAYINLKLIGWAYV
jgi:hypothetical protein